MNAFTLIRRSLRFHARSHLGALLGAAVGSAVLVGALVVGDSVRDSLLRFAMLRLGKTDLALASGDRFFRAELLESLIDALDNVGAAALQLPATATAAGGAKRANRVQLLGVDGRFWSLSDQAPAFDAPVQDGVVLNQPLAEQLGVKPGDSILVRVPQPSQLSREAPISPQEDSSVALRLTVRAIARDEEFGRFGLQASQVPPFNAFVSLNWLQEQLKMPGRANLILMAMDRDAWAPTIADAALRKSWQLADAELELREVSEANAFELRTSRVFMDAPVAHAALSAYTNAQGVLTYFVNELRTGGGSAPYSMVTATGAPIVPPAMRDDEILINQWLADDLKAKPGDELALVYYIVGTMRKLEERTNRFRIHGIVPMDKPYADRSLMPDFPGLKDATNCREWDTGFPIDQDKIRAQDNQYWEDFRGTPKAFVTLAAGQSMWSNRFGNLTAVRYPLSAGAAMPIDGEAADHRAGVSPAPSRVASENREAIDEGKGRRDAGPAFQTNAIAEAILKSVDPASIGLSFEPVRQHALAAVQQSQDFGQLFLGFSFFLIIAALLLMGLLFQFGIEQRAAEVGTLLALGFTPRRVRMLLSLEGAALALAGGIIGTLGGTSYAQAMLRGLSTVWRDASGTSALRYHAEPLSLAVGGFAGAFVAWLTIWLVLRRQAKQPARELLAGGSDLQERPPGNPSALPVFAGSVPPHPNPLPQGEGTVPCAQRPKGADQEVRSLPSILPLPKEEGRGEGEGEDISVDSSASLAGADLTRPRYPRANRGLWIGLVSVILSSVIIAFAALLQETAGVEAFFGAGALLLISGLGFAAAFLSALAHSETAARPTLSGMGVRNATRRRRRSLATIGLLASGSFMVIAVGVFRLDTDVLTQSRASGTGGFALVGESAFPVYHDLNSEDGRQFYVLDTNELAGVEIAPIRVRDGDDASCLNLNRAQKPRLLGVRPELLDQRSAFTFAKILKGAPEDHPWLLLKRGTADGVPAIGDQASIQWALGKKLGDTLEYTDDHGQPFKIRLVASVANSILQGNLLIAEEEFLARFPDENGYRMFLIDAPSNRVENVAATLARALQDVGLELTPTTRRLAAFNAVQNTYLNTFQVLGGLGLLLGSVGLGVVVLRNVMERRGELALLLAVGFRPRVLRWLVMSEHGALLLAGLGIGILAALVAVLPALLSTAASVPFRSLATVLGSVLLSGLIWTWLATVLALRGRLLDALRTE